MTAAQDYLKTLESGFKTDEHQSFVAAFAATPAAGGLTLPTNFCTAWPMIKPILQTVGGFLIYVPVWGATATVVFQGLIMVAQSIYETECSNVPTPTP